MLSLKAGDCLAVLKTLDSNSVHCCVTSPPYWGLRDYGIEGQLGLESSPEEYVAHLVEVFEEVKRVLRKDGTLWLNLGDSYSGSGKPANTSNIQPRGALFQNPLSGIVPAGLKPKDLVGIPWRVAFALQKAGWWLRSDIIWCLSHSTRVYAKTQRGEMPMTVGEMVRLKPETVKLWTGQFWAQVEAFRESEQHDGIEIELRNGQRISCTPEHLWPTARGEVPARDLVIGDKLTSVRLPQPETALEPELIPDEIGWVVGFFIAEGSTFKDGQGIEFATCVDEEEAYRIIARFAANYGSHVSSYDVGRSRLIRVQGGAAPSVVNMYVSGDGVRRKHLSTAAWQRSNKFLSSVLQGYLDGDAHYDKKNGRYRLGFTRNDAWAEDIRTLCARLGYSVRLHRCWHSNQAKKYYGFKGDLRFDSATRRTDDLEIVGLHKSKSSTFYEISVESPHVFALSSGVLTHNCKTNPMPESVTDRPTRSHEHIFLLTKSAKYYYDADAIREPHAEESKRRVMRGQNCNKYAEQYSLPVGVHPNTMSQPREYRGYERMDELVAAGETVLHPNGRNCRDVWLLSTANYRGAHFAVFPLEIPRRAIKAGTSERGCCPMCGAPWVRVVERKTSTSRQSPGYTRDCGNDGDRPGGYTGNVSITLGWRPSCSCSDHDPIPCVVLDPFMGSGTTGVVCLELDRHFIGIDINEHYVNMANRRITEHLKNLGLSISYGVLS